MTQGLTYQEYKSTMTPKMFDVTETAEPEVDIWRYIETLFLDKIVDNYTFENQLVEKIYRNQTNTFDHVLLPTSSKNKFIVIIVDLNNKNIMGYHSLDLNLEYGLT